MNIWSDKCNDFKQKMASKLHVFWEEYWLLLYVGFTNCFFEKIALHNFFMHLIWITFNDFLDCLIFFVMMANKCLTYAVVLSVEVTLHYQTNWIAAQACQQSRLELMTHEKQSPCPGSPRPARTPTAPHIISIPSLRWALCLLHLKIRPEL